MNIIIKYNLIGLLCMFSLTIKSEITLPAYFTDNMVLQQKSTVVFQGKATIGKTIILTTSWDQETHTAQTTENGTWQLPIHTPEAGGPYNISISDGKKKQLKNVMIGEVWFCSGQSNMEMPIAGWGKVLNYEQEIVSSNHPAIRLFKVKKNTSLSPLDDIESLHGGWQVCSPTTVSDFSALAYFYARNLWEKLNIPIGVIDCTWGGTPAEAWTSREMLMQLPDFQPEMKKLAENKFNPIRMQELYTHERQTWIAEISEKDQGLSYNKAIWAEPELHDSKGWQSMSLPCLWEQSGLDGFDGIVWFRRTIHIPNSWVGKTLTLQLGMIDDEDITYCNGEIVAHGSGFMTKRQYTIPAEKVKSTEITLAVRVFDFGGEGGIHGEPTDLYIACNNERISIAGEWKYKPGVSFNDFRPAPQPPVGNGLYPSVLYNAMVYPLTNYPVKGIIWYQGEANVGRAEQYAKLFPAMIMDWRKQWNNENMPFYFVQLANFMKHKEVQPESSWAALREAQAQALHLPNTGMAVTIDIGMEDDIHPKNKQEVGRRLAMLALSNTYGYSEICNAPTYSNYSIKDKQIEIHLYGDTSALNIKGERLKGFTIAGPDGIFYLAEAEIYNGSILVHAPQVNLPMAVRYGWADNPECNLYGANGLPVAPFRTDF